MRMLTWAEKLGRPECPYLVRWVLNLWLFSIRLHWWRGSDDQRCFHDHPWWFVSLILWGGYTEHSEDQEGLTHRSYGVGNMLIRNAEWRHSVEVGPRGAITLMITGPERRQWGFWVQGRFLKRNKYFFQNGHHQCDGVTR